MADLLTLAQLQDLPGVPAESRAVDVACAAIRDECGWHIAPVEYDEVLASGRAGPRMVLPSLRVVDVSKIEVVDTGEELTGWRLGSAGMLVRTAGWPRGEDNLRVTLTHGFDICPTSLLGVVVERLRAVADPAPSGLRSMVRTVGGVTTNRAYRDNAPAWSLAASAVLDRYRV